MSKLLKYGLILLVVIGIAGNFLVSNFKTQKTAPPEKTISEFSAIQGNSLLAVSPLPSPKVIKRIKVVATAYSSRPQETDDSPYITASGTRVRDGIIANNLFPFGTKIRIPEIYGDKVFLVEDRMNQRKGPYHFDIWFASYEEAKNFGAKIIYIEVLES